MAGFISSKAAKEATLIPHKNHSAGRALTRTLLDACIWSGICETAVPRMMAVVVIGMTFTMLMVE